MFGLLMAEVRRRWRSAVLVGLALGLCAGAALTAAVGARRTDTAYPRMVEATNGQDLMVSAFAEDPAVRADQYEAISEVEGVAATAAMVGVNLVPAAVPRGAGTPIEACSNLSADGRFGYTIDRPNVLEGRLPVPDRSDEILVTQAFARTFGFGVGDDVELVRYGGEDTPEAGEVSSSDGPVAHVRVVGVGQFASQVVPVSDLDAAPRVFAGPGFVKRYAATQAEQCYDGIGLELAPGADRRGVAGGIDDRTDGVPMLVQGRETDADVRQAVQPQVTALYLFAGVAGLATLLVLGQLIAREQHRTVATSVATWRALGMTRGEVQASLAAPAALTAVVGALVALAGAWIASERFPIGPARSAETNGGPELHVPLHIGGALAVAVVSVLIGSITARLALRARSTASRTSPAVRIAGRASSPSTVVGAHLAVGSRRHGVSVPIRSTAAGVALAVAAVAATTTVASGLDDLVSQPARYGQDWDLMVDGVFGPAPTGALLSELADNDAVDAIAGARHGEVTIDGQRVGTVAFTDIVGATFPALIEGRRPTSPDEVVLGSRTLADLHRSLGDRVAVDAGEGPRHMTIVGTAAFPRLNRGSFNVLGLGSGAIVRGDAIPPFDVENLGLPPDVDLGRFEDPAGGLHEMVTVRARPDASDAERAEIAALARSVSGDLEVAVRTEQRPIALDRYAAVRSTPSALVLLLGVMAVTMLSHLVASVVWRRRHDLALCGALGMERVQLLKAVGFQSLLISAVALIGLPLGVALGRVVWRRFAQDIGVVDAIRVPVGEVVTTAVLTGAVATAVALLVGAAATARGRHAAALREP